MRLGFLDAEEGGEEGGELGRWRARVGERGGDGGGGDDAGGEVVDGGKVGEEVSALVKRAIREVREWDREVGIRMEFVLREVVWAKWCEGGKGIRMPG